MRRHIPVLLVIVLVLVPCAACRAAPASTAAPTVTPVPATTPATTSTRTATRAPIDPATPTSTPTALPTPTPTLTPTPRPTRTPTATATPSSTPTPARMASPRPPARGPLQVHPANPRYFTDGSGQAIYLTGSHTWHNLQDISHSDPPRVFDYQAYLDLLERRNHNFVRLWRWEMPRYRYESFQDDAYSAPHPWERTGPGEAGDGKPRFDLTRLNQAYFSRLRARVIAARERGIYVSVMLFEGHAMRVATYGWGSHPFHADNNVNGIDGDLDGDGRGLELFTLQDPEVLALQKAYVRQVVDTVNDLDNVLYEIINEAGDHTLEWQLHMLHYLKEYEAGKPDQHPVGMTALMGDMRYNQALMEGPADWVSPRGSDLEPYWSDPPAADGSKVILLDSDHTHGSNLQDPKWIWKGFLRGTNPIYMDPFDSDEEPAANESVRVAMGYTLRFADRIDLAAMVPRDDLASTAYCLANAIAHGSQYLVYLPSGGTVEVDLAASPAQLTVEWFSPKAGQTVSGGTLVGGDRVQLTAPFEGQAVLYIWDAGALPS